MEDRGWRIEHSPVHPRSSILHPLSFRHSGLRVVSWREYTSGPEPRRWAEPRASPGPWPRGQGSPPAVQGGKMMAHHTRPLIGINADFVPAAKTTPGQLRLHAGYFEAVLAAGGLP